VVLATKSVNRTADGIQADVAVSLKELRRAYIDLYQCHAVRDPQDYEQVIGPGGALEGLRQAKAQGLIGHIGITSHSLDLMERVISDGLFDTIMVCYSFLEPRAAEKVIPMAREKGMGIIAMKPFSGGVIPNVRLALKYSLAQPDLLVLAGVEETGLFDENWRVFQQGGVDFSEAENAEIDAIRQKYDKVFCRRCDYCQPCSENIPIQFVLGVRSLVGRSGPASLNGPMVNRLVAAAENCSRCGECLLRCPYELPIPDLIEENVAWVKEQRKAL
jgi:predicted aldo/keto reductase-like oxidoreductase